MGRGGSRGRVTRKFPTGAEVRVPPPPYTPSVKSGTSSTYAYRSTGPEAEVRGREGEVEGAAEVRRVGDRLVARVPNTASARLKEVLRVGSLGR